MQIVDFGRRAFDYARHRPGFPPEFYRHVRALDIGNPGQRVLDVGTGTGTLARTFAAQGCRVVGLDPSPAMLEEAGRAAEHEGVSVRWICAKAEETGLPDGAFDVVSAGQCWHWFDAARAAVEAKRVLRPGGQILIAYFTYLPEPGTVAAATEEILLRHNPIWGLAGGDGRYPLYADVMTAAGFRLRSTFDFVLPIHFSHEDWRGRFRACNGILTLPPETIAAFDDDLARMLKERYREPIVADHRIYGFVAEKEQAAHR